MAMIFSKIRFKISIFVIVLLFCTTLVFYLTTLKIMEVHISNEVIKRAEVMTKSIAASAGYSMLSKDLLGLDNMVFKMQESNPDVEFIAIVGTDMRIIAHSMIGEIGRKMSKVPGADGRKSDSRGRCDGNQHSLLRVHRARKPHHIHEEAAWIGDYQNKPFGPARRSTGHRP